MDRSKKGHRVPTQGDRDRTGSSDCNSWVDSMPKNADKLSNRKENVLIDIDFGIEFFG